MIRVEGYRAFNGTMRIIPVNGVAPFEIAGDWLYKPDTQCWYGQGSSFEEEICEVAEDGAAMPAIDPIKAAGGCYYREHNRIYFRPTDFCSYGKRREAQDDE